MSKVPRWHWPGRCYVARAPELQEGTALVHAMCSSGHTAPDMQGTQKVQTAYSTIETDAQAYVGSMLEVHHESRQLRENLCKQHRIWMDFYATIFRVRHYQHAQLAYAWGLTGNAVTQAASVTRCSWHASRHGHHPCAALAYTSQILVLLFASCHSWLHACMCLSSL